MTLDERGFEVRLVLMALRCLMERVDLTLRQNFRAETPGAQTFKSQQQHSRQ